MIVHQNQWTTWGTKLSAAEAVREVLDDAHAVKAGDNARKLIWSVRDHNMHHTRGGVRRST